LSDVRIDAHPCRTDGRIGRRGVRPDGVGDHRVVEQTLTDRFSAGELEAGEARAESKHRTSSRSPGVPTPRYGSRRYDESPDNQRDDRRFHGRTIAPPYERVKN